MNMYCIESFVIPLVILFGRMVAFRKTKEKIMKKSLTMLLVLAVVSFSLFAAGEQETSEDSTMKVALVLNGPISDAGWNALGYAGLKQIEKTYDVETSFAENVATTDMENVFRSFADLGNDVIFGHGSQFTDAIEAVAVDYPDVQFIIVNGLNSKYDNIACVAVSDEQQGFIMGAIAALTTKVGTVGYIGGLAIPPITNAGKGFEQGVAYIDPSIEALVTMTGSFDDVAKAKETAIAMAGNNADVITAIANQAGLGAIEGCTEQGVLAIGANTDQNNIAPDTVFVSVQKSLPTAYTYGFKMIVDGTIESKVYKLGAKEGVVSVSPWYGHEDVATAEVKAKIEEVVQDIADGKITVQL